MLVRIIKSFSKIAIGVTGGFWIVSNGATTLSKKVTLTATHVASEKHVSSSTMFPVVACSLQLVCKHLQRIIHYSTKMSSREEPGRQGFLYDRIQGTCNCTDCKESECYRKRYVRPTTPFGIGRTFAGQKMKG